MSKVMVSITRQRIVASDVAVVPCLGVPVHHPGGPG